METSVTLHGLFEEQVKQKGSDTALVFGENALSFEQLNQQANQLAHYLRLLGVTPDTKVALCMERSIELMISILGVLKAGGAYVPLDSTHPEERLLLILKEGGTQFLISADNLQKKFSRFQGQIISLEHDAKIKEQPVHNPESTITSRNLAYVIYTSGSTGTPKGVQVEHRGVVDYSLWFADYCDCHALERMDFSSNPAFDFALTTSIIPLLLGMTVVMCSDKVKKDAKQYLKYLKSQKVNFVKLTPSYFKVLLHEIKNKRVELPHLEKVMLAGENLFTAECLAWLNLYPEHILFNEYGPTETSVAVCLYKIDNKTVHALDANVPIGNLAPHIQSYILDEDRKPVAEGESGELYLGGSCLARGYLNKPELTKQYFIQDPFSQDAEARLYKTGDLCRRLAGGEIECNGRIDHQIKIRGFRVEPAEVESYLTEHPALKAGVVIAVDGYHKEKSLIAYYVLNDTNVMVTDSELRHYLKQYLPDYMVPSAFVRMDAFPLNANEKLDRLALPKPQFSASQYYIAPKNLTEKKIAAIWSEELGIKPIGLKDDFFELGGHSLAAARVISTISHKLHKDVSLHDFYQDATIAHLAALVKNAPRIKKQSLIRQASKKEMAKMPLADFQLLLWLSDTFEPKAKKLNIFTRKRIEGVLDRKILTAALQAIFKKHEILSYRVSKFYPEQYLQKNSAAELIEERNLSLLSQEESEKILESSLQQLMAYHPWPKNLPQVRVRLFHLENETEIQLCIPHIISDDVSPEILLSDLSKFYISASEGKRRAKKDTAFIDYLFDEQSNIQQHFQRDLHFWDNYLKDSSLFAFPEEYVVKDMQSQQFAYSTYMEISEEILVNFQAFCAHNHISILDGLCAALMIALANCCHEQPLDSSSFCINRVKSTRESHDYDNTIGCFLRLEPVKLALSQNPNLAMLSQQVHESVMSTNPYQACSNLVKLASIGTFRKKRNILKDYVVKSFVWLYTMAFRSLKLNRKVLSLCGRLSSDKKNNFLINLNVQSSFLKGIKEATQSDFFGFKSKKIKNYQYDLLNIDNVFDVCFLRMVDSNAPYLIISANIKPTFRESIANELIKIIGSECK